MLQLGLNLSIDRPSNQAEADESLKYTLGRGPPLLTSHMCRKYSRGLCKTDLTEKYTDSKGHLRFKGTKQLKESQHYPRRFGEEAMV